MVYRNSEFESTTIMDPRLRVFPFEASTGSVNRIRSQYIKAYNEDRAKCTDYWGHKGRSCKANILVGQLLGQMTKAVFGGCLVLAGGWCIFMYPSLKIVKDNLETPDVTLEEIQRMFALLKLEIYAMACSSPLVLITLIYVGSLIVSLLLMAASRWKLAGVDPDQKNATSEDSLSDRSEEDQDDVDT